MKGIVVVANVYNSWSNDGEFDNLDEAISLTSELIHKSHGGEVYCVPRHEAERILGEDTVECPVEEFYGIDGSYICRPANR